MGQSRTEEGISTRRDAPQQAFCKKKAAIRTALHRNTERFKELLLAASNFCGRPPCHRLGWGCRCNVELEKPMSGTWWLRGLEELMMNAEDIVAAAIAAARAQPVGTGAILALLALLFFVLGRRRTSQITTDDGSTPQTATSSSININFDAGVRRRVGLGSSVRTRIRKRDRVLHAGKVLLRGTQKMGDMLIGKRPVPQRNPLKRQEVPGALLEPMEAADFGTDEVPLEIRLLVESMRIFGSV